MSNPRLDVSIRWLIRRDMPQVLSIEEQSFGCPWSEENFATALRQRNCIGIVATPTEEFNTVLGFMLYELHKARLHVLNFAVHQSYRRVGIGTAMIDKLKSKLSPGRRWIARMEVGDWNTPAHLLLKSCEFRATRVLPGFYQPTRDNGLASAQDAYEFEFSPVSRWRRDLAEKAAT